MKVLKYSLVALSFVFILFTTSCKKEREVKVALGEYVPLSISVDKDMVLPSESFIYSISVVDANGTGLTMNEDVDVKLVYTITRNGAPVDVDPNTILDNPPTVIHLQRGSQYMNLPIMTKSNFEGAPYELIINAVARGYQINGSSKLLRVYDKLGITVAVKGTSDPLFNEGDRFKLVASVPKPVTEDVTVNIIAKSGDADKFHTVPQTIIIKKGFTSGESSDVILNTHSGDNGYDRVSLEFSSTNETYPLYTNEIVVRVNDVDGALDPSKKLEDERWLYPNPSEVFMSETNKEAVQEWGRGKALKLIKPGDPHPNAALALAGWKLINSMEFTPITALITRGAPNQWGNRTSPFFADQNVYNTQTNQAVDGQKYSNMTDDGYLMIWSARDPGIITTGGYAGHTRDYGSACLYQNKYDGATADTWGSSQVKILPGTRIEARIRMRGDLYGFNPAFWLQGNQFRYDQWSYYGEVDILEAPFSNNDRAQAWQTFHWNNNKTVSGDGKNPNSGGLGSLNLHDFNIYWFEWRSNDELAMGINGATTVVIRRSDYPGYWWPFDDIYNKDGMHLLITFGGDSNWALGYNRPEPHTGWDKYLRNIPYDGSKTNPRTPRMEFDWIRYYKLDTYKYDPFANNKSYMY